jgi:signal transduction histidine kinase
VVGPDGTVLCSSLPSVPSTSRVYADAPWVTAARVEGKPVHAEPFGDPFTQRPSLVIAAPVPAPAGSVPAPAVLGAVLDLDEFAPDLIGPLEQARGTVVVAVDPSGRTVLFRTPGRYAGQPVMSAVDRTSMFEATGRDGIRRVFRQTTARELGWRIYAGTPVATAFAAARRTVEQSVALTALVFCMLAVLTALLYHRLVRPTRALTATIVAARAGDDAALAEEDGPAELVRLAAEFNALQVARADARAELQRALVRFTQLQEDERRLIAQSVHDETIQALIATLWALDELDGGTMTPAAAVVLNRVRDNLNSSVAAARSLLFDLRPPALDQLGLAAAIEQQVSRLADETGIETHFESDAQGRLPLYLETLAFRTVQQALQNVRQHSSATAAWVSIRRDDDRLSVDVEDNGVGVDPADLVGDDVPHAGIVAMRETITTAGGSFSIGKGRAKGTLVSFSLPLSSEPSPG